VSPAWLAHLTVVILIACAGCRTAGTEPPALKLSATDAQAIDKVFTPYNTPGAAGAAVVVVSDGVVVFMRGYGAADIDNNIRVTERTNFRLASLTKAFTAMAVMLLVNEGRLSLETPVASVVPEFPVYGRAISVRHLLAHTSGLPPYRELLHGSPNAPLTDREVVKLLHGADALLFPAGSAFRYGDTGYAVLAVVVELVSGSSFATFLRDRIFRPSGMTSTVAWQPGDAMVTERARGYVATPNGFRVDDDNPTSTVLGDGGVYSSVHDLVMWNRALDEHTLVGRQLQNLMWSPGALSDGTRTHYGFGWFVDGRSPAGRVVSHRGDTTGFSHYMLKYLDRGIMIAVLTNRRGSPAADIAARIAALPSVQSRIMSARSS